MSRTILLADDSVTIQKVIELTFMEEDYEVVAAGDGDEALERLDELRPDFVIADVHMPGASGIDVCRRAKQLYPDVPVLLLVGTFEPFDEAEARAAGADAHLKKPFDSQELLQLVDDLMGPVEAAAPSAAAPSAVAPQDGDSTWGFDLAGETEERSAEPEWAAPAAEPEPDWAAEPSAAAGPGEPDEPAGGEGEWGPLDRQPAEVTPPAVGQVEVEEPAWGRPYLGEVGPEAAREPFQLGEIEPRQRGREEVFDLGAGDESAGVGAGAAVAEAEEPAAPAGTGGSAVSGYVAAPGWGFSVEEGEAKGGPAPGAAGAPAPGEGDADQAVAAAGFRWDEPEEPSSLVLPPDEQYPAVAEEPSWGEPSWGEPEEAAPAPAEPEIAAAAPSWSEPGAAFYAEAAAAVPPAAAPPVPAAPAAGLTDGDVERIARRVAELVGERVTREVAWEVVPDLAEVVIRERLRELEGQID